MTSTLDNLGEPLVNARPRGWAQGPLRGEPEVTGLPGPAAVRNWALVVSSCVPSRAFHGWMPTFYPNRTTPRPEPHLLRLLLLVPTNTELPFSHSAARIGRPATGCPAYPSRSCSCIQSSRGDTLGTSGFFSSARRLVSSSRSPMPSPLTTFPMIEHLCAACPQGLHTPANASRDSPCPTRETWPKAAHAACFNCFSRREAPLAHGVAAVIYVTESTDEVSYPESNESHFFLANRCVTMGEARVSFARRLVALAYNSMHRRSPSSCSYCCRAAVRDSFGPVSPLFVLYATR